MAEMHHMLLCKQPQEFQAALCLFHTTSGWWNELSSSRKYHNNSSHDSCTSKPHKDCHIRGIDGYLVQCNRFQVSVRFSSKMAALRNSIFSLQWYACALFLDVSTERKQLDSVQRHRHTRKVWSSTHCRCMIQRDWSCGCSLSNGILTHPLNLSAHWGFAVSIFH